ncbi:hypothetical protein B5X24_HaOG216691 [Helicoverpa armigera]|nr:hypothetical protein B5X24_HaOG216691 [Helicoverpa armigera]
MFRRLLFTAHQKEIDKTLSLHRRLSYVQNHEATPLRHRYSNVFKKLSRVKAIAVIKAMKVALLALVTVSFELSMSLSQA